MRTSYASALASVFLALLLAHDVTAQCDDISVNGVNNMAKTCRCADLGQTNCDLLPDIMISWLGLQNISSGPSEYAQNASSSAGRLRISGATPNVGFGPLEVRGVRADGYRKFICGPVVDSVYSPLTNNINFSCTNGYTAKQILFQRIYHKNDTTMSFNEYERGTMTYHPTHAHYHEWLDNHDATIGSAGSDGSDPMADRCHWGKIGLLPYQPLHMFGQSGLLQGRSSLWLG
ncbi:MAG: hypothetical protein IPO90_11685 [Flavobacteriales bacterium]|nr:hypothetical protein [Flavobacteriales bacterium]